MVETKEKREERIDRVTKMAWDTFRAPTEILYNEWDAAVFIQEAEKLAIEEFWTGEWYDMPSDEAGQVYCLKQFWMTNFDYLMEKVNYARDHMYD